MKPCMVLAINCKRTKIMSTLKFLSFAVAVILTTAAFVQGLNLLELSGSEDKISRLKELLNEASLASDTGNYRKANAAIASALKLAEDLAEKSQFKSVLLQSKSLVYERQGKLKEAIESLIESRQSISHLVAESSEFQSRDIELLIALARLLALSGQKEKAKLAYQAALSACNAGNTLRWGQTLFSGLQLAKASGLGQADSVYASDLAEREVAERLQESAGELSIAAFLEKEGKWSASAYFLLKAAASMPLGGQSQSVQYLILKAAILDLKAGNDKSAAEALNGCMPFAKKGPVFVIRKQITSMLAPQTARSKSVGSSERQQKLKSLEEKLETLHPALPEPAAEKRSKLSQNASWEKLQEAISNTQAQILSSESGKTLESHLKDLAESSADSQTRDRYWRLLLAISERKSDPEASAKYMARIASSGNSLLSFHLHAAELRARAGRYKDAEDALMQAIGEMRKTGNFIVPEHMIWNRAADMRKEQGDLAGAASFWVKAADSSERKQTAADQIIIDYLMQAADSFRLNRQEAKAVPLYKRAILLQNQWNLDRENRVAYEEFILAENYRAMESFDLAAGLYERVLSARKQQWGEKDERLMPIMLTYAANCMQLKNYAKAESLYKSMLKLAESVPNSDSEASSRQLTGALSGLADTYRFRAMYQKADNYYLEAESQIISKYGKNSRELQGVLPRLAQCKADQKNFKAAAVIYGRLAEIIRLQSGAADPQYKWALSCRDNFLKASEEHK